MLAALDRAEIHVALDGAEMLGLTPDQIISDGSGKLSIPTAVANAGYVFPHRNTAGYYGITLNLNDVPEEFNDELHVYVRSVSSSDDTLLGAFVLYDLKT